ncbi:serine/threonine protein kinase [Novipirellula artificiosorum]|uniref:Serine/threonine-protein kinase PknB n=1 Tax=Novipirellula artificiosorum TaxID=2528016 RepID=A0A5C6D7N3_9BACT|nr:serine/threonine-protein kinase [Novipirellula artificiosorum]TWU32818.1 Serine/threonine-protein kinase PknB [Novipirellula artificiosorum]
MGLFDSIKARLGSGASAAKATSRINVEARFERMRTSAIGTMSSFFVARDREQDRIVGVKLLDIEKMELFESRFKRLNKPSEGEIAMGMSHAHIVKTYEAGLTTKGQPILVMEYIEGPSLQHIIVKKQESLVEGRRLMLIREMGEALKYVHSRGFIHRDICPRNYICLPDISGVKLIDFGLTIPATPPFMAPGNRTGTPLYMSPEIVRRRHTDQRVDIFSFGITCYCLCSFKHPWQGDEVNGRAALYHDTSPPKDLLQYCPNIDPKLARAIMAALQPKVEERTPTMDQFLQSIRMIKGEY